MSPLPKIRVNSPGADDASGGGAGWRGTLAGGCGKTGSGAGAGGCENGDWKNRVNSPGAGGAGGAGGGAPDAGLAAGEAASPMGCGAADT
jgi:hypothetical protein